MADIDIPDFDFSGFYYPQLIEALIQYKRANVPEISTESPFDPGIQVLRASALIGHLNNTLLDMVANETLIRTARLRESVVAHLELMGFAPDADIPAKAVLRAQLVRSFNQATLVIPDNALFGTRRRSLTPAILFESDAALTIERTDQLGLAQHIDDTPDWQVEITNSVNTDTLLFNVFHALIQNAQLILSHENVMTDTLSFTGKSGAVDFGDDRTGSRRIIVWEYFDGSVERAEPDSVTNLGFTLKFVLDGLLGTSEPRTGQKCTVTVNATGVTEELDVLHDGTNNYIETTGFLSQTSPSTDTEDYSVGTKWREITGITDTTASTLLVTGEVFDIGDGLAQTFGPTTVQRWPLEVGTQVAWNYTEEGSGLPLEATYELDDDGLPVLGGDAAPGTTVNYATGEMTLVAISVPENAQNITVDYERESQTLQQDGEISFKVPKTNVEDWNLGKLSEEMEFVGNTPEAPTLEAFHIRTRIVSLGDTPSGLAVYDRILWDQGGLYVAVDVTQGRTTDNEVIGSGTGEADQSFELANAPVIQDSVEVFVDGVEVRIVDSLVSSGATDLDAVVTIDSDGIATVKFGDGTNGKTAAVGTNNITATYRTEADVDGNVGSDQIIVNRSGLSRIKNITNPRPAEFWSQQEGATEQTLEKLKRDGIASLRTLDRAVSPTDIEYLTTRFRDPDTGQRPFSRASAIENGFGPKTVKLIVVGVGGVATSPADRAALDEYFNGDFQQSVEGVLMVNQQVVSVDYTQRAIDIEAVVTGGNREAIETQLEQTIHPEAVFDDGITYRWKFGQVVDPSVIISLIVGADPESITKVNLIAPALETDLADEELPIAGNLLITVLEG